MAGIVPSFLAEVAEPAFRPQLHFSVRSGLAIVVMFAFFAAWAVATEVVPATPVYLFPVLLKLATNTMAWVALRLDRGVLPAVSLNVVTDVLALTWAIYLTGGPESTMFAVYSIELTVVALLSNLGTTLLIAGLALAMYVTMVLLVVHGFLPPMPTPAWVTATPTSSSLAVLFTSHGFLLAVPTIFTAAMLKRMRAQQSVLEERTHQLVEAGRERAQFMANVTHELRTPIHGIRGLSEILTSGIYGPCSDRQQRALEEIRRSSDALVGLVDDLLTVARSDAGRLAPHVTDVDLVELVDRLGATTRALVGMRNLEVKLDVDGRLPNVRTDRSRLMQALLNLVANAVKFTPDGGSVRLRARCSCDGVIFDVEDTGGGIPERELERIFEPFHQVDGTASREHGGVGLGLALVKQIADELDAGVSVKSRVGHGSTFTFRIPLRPSQLPPRMDVEEPTESELEPPALSSGA